MALTYVDMSIIPSYLGQTGGSWDWCPPGSFLSTSYILSLPPPLPSFPAPSLWGFEILVVYSVGLGLVFFCFLQSGDQEGCCGDLWTVLSRTSKRVQNLLRWTNSDRKWYWAAEICTGNAAFPALDYWGGWQMSFLCRIFSPTPVFPSNCRNSPYSLKLKIFLADYKISNLVFNIIIVFYFIKYPWGKFE